MARLILDIPDQEEKKAVRLVPDEPEENIFETRLQTENIQKQNKQMGQFLQVKEKERQANDPRNWTYEQTKENFKNNPAKTPEEEAMREALLDDKKKQRDKYKDAKNTVEKFKKDVVANKLQESLEDAPQGKLVEAPEKTGLQKLTDIIKHPFSSPHSPLVNVEENQARDYMKYVVAGAKGRDPADINDDDVRAYLREGGVSLHPSTKELAEKTVQVGAVAGLAFLIPEVAASLGTAGGLAAAGKTLAQVGLGVAGYWGAGKFKDYVVEKASGKEREGERHLSELIPQASSAVRGVLDLGEEALKIYAAGKLARTVPSTEKLTTKEIPQRIKISKQELSDITRGVKIDPDKLALVKSLNLKTVRPLKGGGFTVDLPAKRVDRAWFAKVKQLYGEKPITGKEGVVGEMGRVTKPEGLPSPATVGQNAPKLAPEAVKMAKEGKVTPELHKAVEGIIRAGGGDPLHTGKGTISAGGGEAIVYWNDPTGKHGSTLVAPLEGLTPEIVKNKLLAKEKEFARAKVSASAEPPQKPEAQASAGTGEPGPVINKEPVKSIETGTHKRLRLKKKAIKEKQLQIEDAQKTKEGVQKMIRERRFRLNLATYETNLYTNDIESVTSKEDRELIPFLIEGTDIPKELGRPDLEQRIVQKGKELQPLANDVKEHFHRGWQYMKQHVDDLSAQEIENYVTHLWEVPKAKQNEISNWFTTKNRFLKKRFIETYKEGIEKGLKPKTLDIAEIIRIHDNVMHKTTENAKFVKDLKRLEQEGVKLIARSDQAPPNWVYMDHPSLRQGMVIPKDPKRGEKLSDELVSLLNEMGVAVGRRISPTAFGKPTKAGGFYVHDEPPEIRLQRFFSSKTAAHEIGHHLDKTLKLGEDFVKRHKKEIMDLNKDRIDSFKGATGKYSQAYVESTPELIAELFAHVFAVPDKAYKLAPNATAEVLERLRKDEVLTKLIDFDFESKAKLLLEEQMSTMVKLPVKVHPDIAGPLNVIFESRFNHPIIRAYETMNGLLKKAHLSLSLFHHGALTETAIPYLGPARTAGIFFNFPAIYKAISRGDYTIYKRKDAARKWISRGLQVGATADIPVNRIQRGLNDIADKTKNIPVLKQAARLVANFNATWDKALWNYLHDTLKLYSAESLGAKVNPKLPPERIKKEEEDIAQIVNDTFGGQNWEVLMVSPKTLQIASWLLLSPDWTISTMRQAFAPTGIGAIHKESVKIRKDIGRMFWLKAALYFGIGINLLNAVNRRKDMEDNPEYYPKELKSDKLVDLTMVGNSVGHRTHLFGGRYKDGKERYIRWGKQFRELPELLFDDTGFSPISATLRKVGGKLSPNIQLASIIATGHSSSGFKIREIADKKGWERVGGIGMQLLKSPFPFSTRSLLQKDKEFHLSDLAMPSSKGMSRYKTVDLFRIAIERKDQRLFIETWDSAIRNKIPPEKTFKAAVTLLKATNTREINSKMKSVEDIERALRETPDLKTRKILRRRRDKLREESRELRKGGQLLRSGLLSFQEATED